jgi:hypothetical protein
LHWDTVMGDGIADLQAVETTVKEAIGELR